MQCTFTMLDQAKGTLVTGALKMVSSVSGNSAKSTSPATSVAAVLGLYPTAVMLELG